MRVGQQLAQMFVADAIFDQVSAEIEGRVESRDKPYVLRASASHLRFPGFRQLYIEGRDGNPEDEDSEKSLPELAVGDALRALAVQPDQHFTEPPPRYTEASLVKALEENGIGRPSTYATIMSTLQDRDYVKKDGRALKPQEIGLVVSDMMTSRFPGIVDIHSIC